MSPRRLRAGEWLAGAGTVALLGLLLFADWFSGEPSGTGAGALGWPVVVLLGLLAGLAIWLILATAAGATTAQLMVAAVLTVVVGAIALLVTVVRVTAAQPGADEDVGVSMAGYLGLVAVAAILAGAWRAMADERTDAPESAVTPPPARPAPPPET